HRAGRNLRPQRLRLHHRQLQLPQRQVRGAVGLKRSKSTRSIGRAFSRFVEHRKEARTRLYTFSYAASSCLWGVISRICCLPRQRFHRSARLPYPSTAARPQEGFWQSESELSVLKYLCRKTH